MRVLSKIYLIIIILSVSSCYPDTRTYTSGECSNNFKSVNVYKIIRSASRYDSQFVEISGYYYSAFEQSGLSPYIIENPYENVKMLWIDLDRDLSRKNGVDTISLSDSWKEFQRIKKRIMIRGMVDAESHGHLGQYAATIKNVCYLRILD
jgi:hypothetical protein